MNIALALIAYSAILFLVTRLVAIAGPTTPEEQRQDDAAQTAYLRAWREGAAK